MAKGAYTYEPGRLKEPGMDRMRFELGDVMVEGGSETDRKSIRLNSSH